MKDHEQLVGTVARATGIPQDLLPLWPAGRIAPVLAATASRLRERIVALRGVKDAVDELGFALESASPDRSVGSVLRAEKTKPAAKTAGDESTGGRPDGRFHEQPQGRPKNTKPQL